MLSCYSSEPQAKCPCLWCTPTCLGWLLKAVSLLIFLVPQHMADVVLASVSFRSGGFEAVAWHMRSRLPVYYYRAVTVSWATLPSVWLLVPVCVFSLSDLSVSPSALPDHALPLPACLVLQTTGFWLLLCTASSCIVPVRGHSKDRTSAGPELGFQECVVGRCQGKRNE